MAGLLGVVSICRLSLRILASMSETDRRADTASLNWSDLGVSELPTGTVTLLLADVEGSTRLWQTQPDDMSAAVARLDCTLADLIAAHQRGPSC